jgi:hypothetical protein
MTQFPSQRNLSSWAGICPGNNRSAGKNRSNRPTGGNRWLRGALTECAWAAAAKKNCFLKEKFWRITTKSRGKKNSALLAVADTILQLVYEVLRTGQPYRDRQAPALSGQQKDRLIRHHVRRLGKLWGPSSFAPRWRWFPRGTIRELTKPGEVLALFSEEPVASMLSNILRRGCFPLSPFCPHHAAIHRYRAQLTNVCFHNVAMPRYHVRIAF